MSNGKKFAAFLSVILLMAGFCGCEKPVTSDGGSAATLKIFSDLKSTNSSNLAWISYAEKENGIKLEFISPPASNYKERLQIMLASGDYPDIVLFKDGSDQEFIDAVKSGIVVPLNEQIAGKENLDKYTYDYSWDAMKVLKDEKIFGIPRSTLMRTDGFFVREDWLENVGLSIPEDRTVTLEQFYEILKRFSNDDPDQNGKKDTYGLSTYFSPTVNVNEGMVLPVEESFGLFGWQKAENEDYEYMNPKYSKKNRAFQKALAFNAKLFHEKLIDPDAPVISTAVNSHERFKRGIAGVIRGFPGFLESFDSEMKKIMPGVKLGMITGIKDANGSVKAGTPFSTGYFGLWAVTSQNKDVEKSVKLLDWMLSDEIWETTMYGMEGTAFTMSEGKRVFNPNPEDSHSLGRSIVRRNTDVDFYITNSTPPELIPLIKETINECMEVSVPSLDRGFKPAASATPRFIDYQKEMIEVTTKILLGNLPVERYDEALEGWYESGGREFSEEMNSYIKQISN